MSAALAWRFRASGLDHFVPWYVTFPIAILGSAAFGALWALIPG